MRNLIALLVSLLGGMLFVLMYGTVVLAIAALLGPAYFAVLFMAAVAAPFLVGLAR